MTDGVNLFQLPSCNTLTPAWSPAGLAPGLECRYMNDTKSRSTSDEPQEPRTGGEVSRLAPVQIALALLVIFLALLGLWLIWPLITGT